MLKQSMRYFQLALELKLYLRLLKALLKDTSSNTRTMLKFSFRLPQVLLYISSSITLMSPFESYDTIRDMKLFETCHNLRQGRGEGWRPLPTM